MTKIEFGRMVRKTRLENGLSMTELANLVGTSVVYMGEIERGLKMPSINTFIKIINALNVSADYILRYEVNKGDLYICDDIMRKLSGLANEQKKTIISIVDAYINNLTE